MKRVKDMKHVIALILVVAMVLPLFPMYAIAASTFDVSQWNTTGWIQSTEYGHTVLTADSATDNASLCYTGSMEGVNSVEAEIRYNESRWGEASGGFILYSAAGVQWYVDYRADANTIRIRRDGEYVTYCTLGFTPKAKQWVHWEVCWDDTTIYVFVNGEQVLSCNYAERGDVFNSASTFKFYEWGQPMSVRAVKMNKSIAAMWNTGTYQVTKEDGVTVLTGNTNSNEQITYRGSMAGIGSIEADIRYNATETAEASSGIILYTESGVEWYVDYRADGNYVRIRRNGDFLTYTNLANAPAANEWMHWELSWDGVHITIAIDGKPILTQNYANFGDVFGAASAPVKFNHWLQPMSVKNIELSAIKWSGEFWNTSAEGNTTVYTATAPENSTDAHASAEMYYYGSMAGVNTIELDMRYNASKWTEASSGIMLYTNEGAQWWIDYRADGNYVRIRRNGEYLNYTNLTNAPAADAWMHWTLSWDDTNITIAIDGEPILTQNYASFNDAFDQLSSVNIHHWGQPASVKNMKLGKAAKKPNTSDWTLGDWTAAYEGENVVFTGDPLSSNDVGHALIYLGDVSGYNTVKFGMRYNQTRWGEANAGLKLYDRNNNEWYIDYRADANYVRIRRNDNFIVYPNLPFTPQANEWMEWEVTWFEGNIIVKVNGNVVATADYASYGDDFSEGATMRFNEWGQPISVKNVMLSKKENQPDTSDWTLGDWTAAYEGDDVVFTGDPLSSDDVGHALIYLSDVSGYNTVKFGMRYNQTRWGEANAGLKLYDRNNNEWYIDYRADANYVRIRRNDNFIVYPNLPFTPQANEWMEWEVSWIEGVITVKVNGNVVALANYASYGDDFSEGATMRFNEWGQPVSIKNVKLSKVERTPDTSDWTLGDWTAAYEGDDVVFTGDSASSDSTGHQLVYLGNLNGYNSVKFGMRYNQTRWGEANAGLYIVDANNNKWYIDYRADANYVRIRRNDNFIVYPNLPFTPQANEWMEWEVIWSDGNLYVKVNGEVVAVANYAIYGDDFSEGATMYFNEWGQPVSIKNVTLSNQVLSGWVPNASWIKGEENGEDVYSAQIPEFNDGIWPTLSYVGSLENINSISYKYRYNKTWYGEAWGGLIMIDANGNEWNLDYRADSNNIRIRRNGNYVAVGTLDFVPKADEWMDFQVIWSDTTLYLKINGKIVLEHKYSSYGDAFNKDASVQFKCWGQPISVKDMVMETVKPSAWNFVDLEFTSPYSVESFVVTGGNAVHQDGQMIVDITAGGLSLQSPRIEVSAGSQYSAFLPVRNTLVVRMKNDTAADHITLYFVSTLHQEYGQLCSKTFEIEPYSDYTTYFFNLSDVIYMGSAANPYKYTSQVMDSEGYLRGFKLVLPENVTEGTIALDAVTFEREDPLYDYAGEITSTIADKETSKITITGKVDPALAGKEVIIYESAVNNYSEGMSYPINTEHKVEMVDIEKLTTAVVQADGSFTATIDLYAEDKISRLSSLFLAYVDGVKVSGHFSVDNYQDFYEIERFEVPNLVVDVTDPQFGAKGDAFTDDTKAIQAAIDYVAAQGGGVVVIPGDTSTWHGRRYIATNINLKSNIELRIEEGAMIWQSQRAAEYDYSNNYFTDKPIYGHDNDREGVVWAHSMMDNLPLVYVGGEYDRATGTWGEPITNVRITGGGTIRMMDVGGEQPDPHNYAWNSNLCVGCSNRIHLAPLALWNAEHVDLVGITIQRSNNWHITTSGCNDMYYANNTLEQAACINSDSFGNSNSKNIVIFRNFVYGNDDGVTLSISSEEKRGHLYYFVDPNRDNSVENIEIISNQIWNGLGVAFLPWGTGGEDASRYLTKNILIYDNVLGGESCAIGSWPDNPTYGWSSYYTYSLDNGERDDWSAIQDVRIINNRLRKPYNLRIVEVTNLVMENTAYKGEQIGYYQSRAAKNFLHGDFDKVIRSTEVANGFKDETNWVVGLTNWSSVVGENGSVGTAKIRADLKYSGYIKGNGELWQGIYLMLGAQKLTLKVHAVSGTSSVFVADHEGNVIAEQPITNNADFEEITFTFTVPSSDTYRLGVKHQGNADQIVYLDDASVERSELNNAVPENATTTTYPFDSDAELADFRLLSSGESGFKIVDGKLAATGTDGEYKAVLNDFDHKYWSVSVEIHPGQSGEINAGLYLGASGGGDSQDSIRALGILLESNFEGWSDAANRVDLVVGSFPNWNEIGRYTAETGYGNNLFTNGVKEPLKLTVDVRGKIVTITVSLLSDSSVFIQTVLEYTGQRDLHHGTVGLRALNSDVLFDNLTLVHTEPDPVIPDDSGDSGESGGPGETEKETSDKVTFNGADSANKFDFYTSSNGGFVVKDGKLVPSGETGEFKAIYKDDGMKFNSISVDIYPGADGINSGIYIGAGKADHGVDKIKALAIFVESNFPHEGEAAWDDAVNRIDLVVGQFPIWKELHRYTSETGEGNALFAGTKEPVNLRVDIDGKLLTITLSLLNDPSVFVTTTYEYTGTDDLSLGNVGLRSAFSGASFDNFTVYGEGGKADDGETGNNSGSTTPDTGDHALLAAVALAALVSLAALLSMAWLEIKKKYFA